MSFDNIKPSVLVLMYDLTRGRAGGKAIGLQLLKKCLLKCPDTLVLTSEHHFRSVFNEKPLPVSAIFADLVKTGWKKIIARSSGYIEDGDETSLPGVLESVVFDLGIDSLDKVIKTVYNSLLDTNAQDYLSQLGLPPLFSISVLFQEYVEAELYGNSAVLSDKFSIVSYWSFDKPNDTLTGELDAFKSMPFYDDLERGLEVLREFYLAFEIEWAWSDAGGLTFLQCRELINLSSPEESNEQNKLDNPLLHGFSVGNGSLIHGEVVILKHPSEFEWIMSDKILVTFDTSELWEPVLKHFKAVITDHGTPTSHLSLRARELGIRAVVGTVGATKTLKTGDMISISGGVIAYYKQNEEP